MVERLDPRRIRQDPAALQAAFQAQQQQLAAFNRRTLLSTQVKALSNSAVGLSSAALSRQMVQQTASSATGLTGEILQQIGLFYNQAVRSRRSSLVTAYTAVGEQANKATYNKYRSSVGGSAAYRANAAGKMRRDAGGRLGGALKSPNMYLAGPDGIAYVNRTFLDSQARQWYRLNFGTQGGAQIRRPVSRTIMFFGQNTGMEIGLQGYGPSKGFSMPAGFFLNGGGQIMPFGSKNKDRFDPVSYIQKNNPSVLQNSAGLKARGTTSRGIASTNFLDAGVAVIAKGVPQVTTTFIRTILRESFESGGAVGTPALAGLDTKQIGRLLDRAEVEVAKLPVAARQLNAELNRLYG